jgi:hypothetical protein
MLVKLALSLVLLSGCGVLAFLLVRCGQCLGALVIHMARCLDRPAGERLELARLRVMLGMLTMLGWMGRGGEIVAAAALHEQSELLRASGDIKPAAPTL